MAMLKLDARPWLNFMDKRMKKIQTHRKAAVIALGKVAIKEAQNRLPAGNLRQSIGNPSKQGIYKLTATRDLIKLEVGTKVPYCVIVEKGIAHRWLIPPKPMPKGRWMKFYWEKIGRIVFAKQVKHPEMKGKFYMTHAFNAVIRELNKIVTRFF